MRSRDLETLELHKILEALAESASSSAGAEACRALRPGRNAVAVERRLATLDELMRLQDEHPETPSLDVADLRPVLALASREGAVLDGPDLVAVREDLRLARATRRYLGLPDEESAALLAEIAERLEPPQEVERSLKRTLDDSGRVREDATPELRELRATIRRLREDLEQRLTRLLDDSNEEVVAEHYVTIRSDRYVVPIRAGAAARIPGVIQDRSGSGETVFLEPLFAVELNNRLVLARKEEDAEERRIRGQLTRLIRRERESLDRVFRALVECDVLVARARLARRLGGVIPRVGGEEIRLVGARHPLLLLGDRPVTPVDLCLPSDCRGLVVTGPNTGGKTVALKTVGLLALMAQCGLAIPVDANSSLPVFEQVFADIGDAQSLERNLSTFSSHMENLAGIAREADARSLVLLDEPGVGTDPSEGAALAVGFLVYVADRGAFLAASSHAADVKTFALSDPRFDVAAVDLDLATSSPRYTLKYHTLGQSLALPMARRTGVPEPILAKAEQLLSGRGGPDVARAIERLEETRSAYEAKLGQLEARAKTLAAREAEYTALAAEVREKKKRAWAVALAEAREFVRSLRSEGEEILAELRRSGGRASPFRKAVAAQDAAIDARAADHSDSLPAASSSPPVVGDEVEVAGQGIRGELVEVRGERARIRRGPLRFEVPAKALRRVEAGGGGGGLSAGGSPPVHRVQVVDVADESEELSLLGLRKGEAVESLELFLDRAVRAGRPWVRIIHGLGSGALRRAVHDFLEASPYCSDFHDAPQAEGGAGVTVVDLAT